MHRDIEELRISQVCHYMVKPDRRAAEVVREAASLLTDGSLTDDIPALVLRLQEQNLQWAWQLQALDAADWIALGVSMGLKAAVKHSMRASGLNAEESVVLNPSDTSPSDIAPSHASLARARKQTRWGVGVIGWRNVHLSWLHALVDSDQPGSAMRAALAGWTDGYTIQWLLFFATVVPVSFDISDRVTSTSGAELQMAYGVVTAFLIGCMLCGIWMASYTSQVVGSVSDANMSTALAGPLLPMFRQLLTIYNVGGAFSVAWLHLSLHLAFVGNGAPWWFAMLLHGSAFVGLIGMFGCLGAFGMLRGRMDGSVMTTLVA